MNRSISIGQLVSWLVVALPAAAQVPAGDGLKGDYYTGTNFEQFVLTRRDTLVDFDWYGAPPASGVPAKAFSVRWTGWLVPPVTGHYVLHLDLDDGVRFWITGRQFLNEWQDQPLAFHEISLDLVAGQPYPLQLEYGQYTHGTRVLLAWERPDKPTPENARHLLRKTTKNMPYVEVVPTHYLFSSLPKELKKLPGALAAAGPPAAAKPTTARATRGTRPSARHTPPEPPRAAAVASQLAAGQDLTFKALYFEQGTATLLPSVRACLDTLVLALRQRTKLRLEVQGHTDNQGNPTLNRQLSQQRAEAVCQYLAAHGIAAERLRPVGYGGSQPVADNRVLALRAQNRRVVLRPLP